MIRSQIAYCGTYHINHTIVTCVISYRGVWKTYAPRTWGFSASWRYIGSVSVKNTKHERTLSNTKPLASRSFIALSLRNSSSECCCLNSVLSYLKPSSPNMWEKACGRKHKAIIEYHGLSRYLLWYSHPSNASYIHFQTVRATNCIVQQRPWAMQPWTSGSKAFWAWHHS